MITRDDVCFAYRLFLDREPESEEVVSDLLRIANTTAELRRSFFDSPEYQRNAGLTEIGGAVVPLEWPVRALPGPSSRVRGRRAVSRPRMRRVGRGAA